jgi:hypothetical protein
MRNAAMSDNPDNKPGLVDESPVAKPDAPRLGRRLFIFRATAILTGAATLALGTTTPQQAQAQRTDRDPTDRRGRGRGVTDSDPTDRAGRGSDNDPNDRAGRGRGSGATDNDPNDRAGRGRRGGSDRDPDDP